MAMSETLYNHWDCQQAQTDAALLALRNKLEG